MGKTDSMLYVSKLAYNIAPYDHEVLSNYGYSLERVGRREEAKKVLTEALRINPYYESTTFNLVVLNYNVGNYKEAYRLLCTIPDYESKHAPYIERIRQKAFGQKQ
jgi:Flp pilus assembly protein TadD